MLSTYRRCAAGAATVALALLGTGRPPAASADTGGPELSRFYHQRIEWGPCEGVEMPADLRCGKVTVPLDYARPGAGTLDLAMARYEATGKKKRGSVLLNFGGPGGAGIPLLAHSGEDFMGLTDGYDVVTFDPRGVGRSSPVSCGEGTDQFLEATDDSDDARDPRASLKLLRKAAAACREHSGPVLPHIGTVNVSRDLDVMRAALGDDKLDYLGFSYGTRLGAVYAAQFPDRVGRMALDGVDTLTDTPSEQGLAAARGQQTALEHYLEACTEELTCPFGEDTRSAREQVVALVRSLDENPVPTADGPELTGEDLVGAMSQALYSEELWPALTEALSSLLLDGDTRRVRELAGGGSAAPYPLRADPADGDRKPGRDQGGGLVAEEDVPLDNLPAALMAVNCADDPDRPSAGWITEEIGRLRAAYEKASPVFGPYRLTQVLMCHGRPKGTDFVQQRVRDVDTAKMLLVGTRGDPATPYRWTVETAQRLGPSAVVLDNRDDGHTGYGSSKCVHRKIDDFLLYGSLPDHGSSCGPED
ncbi:alpha/beta hydrolase [Streptomyces poonensis]|uniref:Protease n=1 Tax=Streptomyces poonensis TaxID=68255 RepID=A0A918UFC2_9ACTN|nr:alpha/beta hydrolase [Streptomyces poonensis]GGZ00966.1 protease [Streptomyces poonensis]GLJ90403.1 protease [Streptomyces poonensis]